MRGSWITKVKILNPKAKRWHSCAAECAAAVYDILNRWFKRQNREINFPNSALRYGVPVYFLIAENPSLTNFFRTHLCFNGDSDV